MIGQNLIKIRQSLPEGVTLVAVSKTKPIQVLEEAYSAGQRDFGENKVQEMVDKYEQLPKDIRWHMIGHLQTNKVKYIVPFVHLIHGVDSLKLLQEINKQAVKVNRKINTLLQIYIATEESKFGLSVAELDEIIAKKDDFQNIVFSGFMGMASFTHDQNQVKKEFSHLKQLFDKTQSSGVFGDTFTILSMGMSGDYPLAVECGSTMVRVGSSIFGER
jgi:pyridoxal phosphate enzyme (YggS family)